MDKSFQLTQLDPDQIQKQVFDEGERAYRVVLLNNTEQSNAPQSNTITQIERIEVPIIVKELEIKEITIPVIVKEVQIERIEVPVIVKETVIQIERIEVPVFINKREETPFNYKPLIETHNKWLVITCGIQTCLLIALLVKYTIF